MHALIVDRQERLGIAFVLRRCFKRAHRVCACFMTKSQSAKGASIHHASGRIDTASRSPRQPPCEIINPAICCIACGLCKLYLPQFFLPGRVLGSPRRPSLGFQPNGEA